MKCFLLVPVFLLVITQEAYSVHKCYQCSGEDCKNETLSTVDCRVEFGNNTAVLCESRQEGGQTTKGCIENKGENIANCDSLNVNKTASTACYYCDRELCNSASMLGVSIMVLFVAFCATL